MIDFPTDGIVECCYLCVVVCSDTPRRILSAESEMCLRLA